MNKRGQFFLVAAVIIVGLVIGLATTVNSARVGDSNEAFYDLAEEVDFETKKVLDYGVFTGAVNNQLLVQNFLNDYSKYIAQEEVLFIYGDATNMEALIFEDTGGSIGISTAGSVGGAPIQVPIQYISPQDFASVELINNNLVQVEISGVFYDFNLRDGQNFFFVIGKEESGEKFVAKNE